jgi:O-methyltransferase
MNKQIGKETVLSRRQINNLINMLYKAMDLPGDVAECGVFRGGSTSIILNEIKNTSKTLYALDTFEGIPDADSSKDVHKNKDFNKTSYELVYNKLKSISNNFELIKGNINITLDKIKDKRFCFVHIDTDTYMSYKVALNFFYPRTNGIILFDDYLIRSCPGAKLAVDGFFEDKPETIVQLEPPQAYVRIRKEL